MRKSIFLFTVLATISLVFIRCGNGSQTQNNSSGALSGDLAERVYVAPGEHDEYYAFISGGFSGQLAVHGLPSGRLFKVIPVFSQDAEKAYGYNEETKPLLETSYGFVPWDDAHHPDLSQTNGVIDGRWCFINANRADILSSFEGFCIKLVQ